MSVFLMVVEVVEVSFQLNFGDFRFGPMLLDLVDAVLDGIVNFCRLRMVGYGYEQSSAS